MLADQHRFADEHRLCYCFQLLQGEALAPMEPFLREDGHIAFDTAKDFLKELTRVFGDDRCLPILWPVWHRPNLAMRSHAASR